MSRRRAFREEQKVYVINSTDNPKIMSLIYSNGWSKSPDGITERECGKITRKQVGETFAGSYICPEGYNITSDDKEDFDGFKYFTSLTTLPDYAFYNTDYIRSITIPSTTTAIGYRTFQGTKSIESLYIPSNLTFIDNGAFLSTQIHSITFSEGLKSIGYGSFRYAQFQGDFILPNSLTDINSQINTYTFQGLYASHIRLSPNCKSYPSGAFQNSRVSSLDIPEGVTTINSLCFNGCNNLRHVEFPSTITKIGNRAFNVTNIEYFIFNSVDPPILDPRPNTTTYENFSVSNTEQMIYVPDNSVDAYKTATGWSTFASRIKPISEFNQ